MSELLGTLISVLDNYVLQLCLTCSSTLERSDQVLDYPWLCRSPSCGASCLEAQTVIEDFLEEWGAWSSEYAKKIQKEFFAQVLDLMECTPAHIKKYSKATLGTSSGIELSLSTHLG